MKHCIAHELGHCNHYAYSKLDYWKSVINQNEFKKIMDNSLMKTACNNFFPSDYHKTNSLEFVAETFSVANIRKELGNILQGDVRQTMLDGYKEVACALGDEKAPDNAARQILEKVRK